MGFWGLQVCPLPAAQQALASLRERDPKAVEQAMSPFFGSRAVAAKTNETAAVSEASVGTSQPILNPAMQQPDLPAPASSTTTATPPVVAANSNRVSPGETARRQPEPSPAESADAPSAGVSRWFWSLPVLVLSVLIARSYFRHAPRNLSRPTAKPRAARARK